MEAIIAFAAGFIVGLIVLGLAIELGVKKTLRSQPASRPTHKWSIDELSNPRVVAEFMGADVKFPSNARVVVNQFENKEALRGMAVKKHSGIRGNYILGDDRALILAGPISQHELGVWTVEKEMLEKLNRYFEDSWNRARQFDFESDN